MPVEETAEEKKQKTKKKKVGKPIGDPVGTGCPNDSPKFDIKCCSTWKGLMLPNGVEPATCAKVLNTLLGSPAVALCIALASMFWMFGVPPTIGVLATGVPVREKCMMLL